MKNQRDLYLRRYPQTKNILLKCKDEELDKLAEYVEDLVDTMSLGLKIKSDYFVTKLRRYDLSVFTNKYIGSHYVLGLILTENDKIEWINCGCGSVGKFRRVK